MNRFKKRIEQGFDRFADQVTPSSTALEAFRNRTAEEPNQPDMEIIMLQETEQPPSRRALAWVLSAAAAIALVVAGSIALTRGDDLATTADDPTPPTSVVTVPESPPVHEMSAEFTGDDCVYAGPTDFAVGDEFEITLSDVAEERMDVGFAVRKLVDGTSEAELREKGLFAVNEGDAAALRVAAVTEQGKERVMSGTFDVAGTWVVNCFIFSAGLGGDFPALIFEVAEDS